MFWTTLLNSCDDKFFSALTVIGTPYSVVCVWIYICVCPVFIRILSHTYYRWLKQTCYKQNKKLVIAEIKFLYKTLTKPYTNNTSTHTHTITQPTILNCRCDDAWPHFKVFDRRRTFVFENVDASQSVSDTSIQTKANQWTQNFPFCAETL